MIRETFTFFSPEERPSACRSAVGDLGSSWAAPGLWRLVSGIALAPGDSCVCREPTSGHTIYPPFPSGDTLLPQVTH